MDSQLTLIDPVAHQQSLAHTILCFSVDNVHNATLSLPGSSACYVIESSTHVTRTKITRMTTGLEPVVVGVVERSSIAPDKIKLGSCGSMRVSEWLKAGRFSSRYLPATMEIKGYRYIWRVNFAGQLSMYAEEDESIPLAWLDRSRTKIVDGQTVATPAVLALQEEVDGFRDEVVVAAVVLEHKRRMSEKATAVMTGTGYAGQGYHAGGFVL